MTRTTPYGAWTSPITAAGIAAGSVGLSQIAADGDAIYWVEARPTEDGRAVLVRWRDGSSPVDVTPPPWNVRTRVHEYGGGAFAVRAGIVCISHAVDGRWYRLDSGGAAVAITPAGPFRWADGAIDRARDALVLVREEHGPGGEPANTIVRVDLGGSGSTEVLVAGDDFYASPRLAPDGATLAWLAWRHPNMPWDGTELWTARLDDAGALHDRQLVAGGADESIFQPEWSPDGVLHWVSDRSGWWNLYRAGEALCPMDAELGVPQWAFGLSTYDFLAPDRIVCAYGQRGTWRVGVLDVGHRRLEPLPAPYTDVGFVRAACGRIALRAGAPDRPAAVVTGPGPGGAWRTLRASIEPAPPAAWLATPEAIAFPSADGRTAHALFYRPRNPDHTAPATTRPPLLVRCHGGPTGAVATSLELSLQFWTSRGFAVADVDYGGSSGYGRAYRRLLDGQWGVVDVEDCVAAARFVVAQGWVDPTRLAVRGSSAGGFTALCALAFADEFSAGASLYGIGDLEALARDTHKFEAHYTDRLVGPYPERADLYRARSPLHAADRITAPVIFFQGLDDAVVPPNQAEAMVAALRARGVEVGYVAYEGEAHGFRRADTIRRTLEEELRFYLRVWDLALPDGVSG